MEYGEIPQSSQKFLDIFVVINHNALMPEVFTMVVNDVSQKPQYPQGVDYPALPISGVPAVFDTNQNPTPSRMQGSNYLTPAIFYLDGGIMLFFRVPLAEANAEQYFCDNYFGPQDLMGGGLDIPPFLF